MHESPRIRRLHNDFASMERLCAESSVIRFRTSGKPPQQYVIAFHGRSLSRQRGKVAIQERHEVEIKLGSSYPRTMPEIRWMTPIYHPNISEIGMVCLGGYGTHWVPSLNLDELCGMLWDMARFHNYDIRSPYNREAALWVANQTKFLFPLDTRPLRDLRAALGRVESAPAPPPLHPDGAAEATSSRERKPSPPPSPQAGQKASKYADFVRRFASDLESITPAQSGAGNGGVEFRNRSTPIETEDGVIILDMEVDLRPSPPRPPRQDDEIVFIE